MYTATMNYPVKPDAMEDFVALWEEKVLDLAIRQEGFVRMQILTRENEAMAMGTWDDKSSAEAFMTLGPFKRLMEAAKEYLSGDPRPTVWSLAAFAAR